MRPPGGSASVEFERGLPPAQPPSFVRPKCSPSKPPTAPEAKKPAVPAVPAGAVSPSGMDEKASAALSQFSARRLLRRMLTEGRPRQLTVEQAAIFQRLIEKMCKSTPLSITMVRVVATGRCICIRMQVDLPHSFCTVCTHGAIQPPKDATFPDDRLWFVFQVDTETTEVLFGKFWNMSQVCPRFPQKSVQQARLNADSIGDHDAVSILVQLGLEEANQMGAESEGAKGASPAGGATRLQPDEWSCPKCTLTNKDAHVVCPACGYKPAPPQLMDVFKPPTSDQDFWVCGFCTLHNSTHMTTCAACTVRRSEPGNEDDDDLYGLAERDGPLPPYSCGINGCNPFEPCFECRVATRTDLFGIRRRPHPRPVPVVARPPSAAPRPAASNPGDPHQKPTSPPKPLLGSKK